MNASDACETLIKQFEGCGRAIGSGHFTSYPDPGTGGDPWTIGYGSTGPDIKKGTVWTQAQCEQRFDRDVQHFAAHVAELLGSAKTTQNQFDALVSWTHNVGEGALSSSTLVRMLNERNYKGASAQFRRWNIPAMITSRRAGEWVQFNTPDGKPNPARSEFDARYP